jgi:hypothetical protein
MTAEATGFDTCFPERFEGARGIGVAVDLKNTFDSTEELVLSAPCAIKSPIRDTTP